ncbi:MAG: hypothetical protein NXH85_05000 [Pseudomonadaceae bacterium]|nr:hypothetical protein [Pseudomonadaceae bacterium]
MNRSLGWFVVFLLLLAAAAWAVRWWAGPGLSSLLLDADRRAAPALILVVSEGSSVSGPEARQHAASLGARLLWHGSLDATVSGELLRSPASAALVSFPTGGDLLRAITGSDFDAVRDAIEADMGGQLFAYQINPDADVSVGQPLALLLASGATLPIAAATRLRDISRPYDGDVVISKADSLLSADAERFPQLLVLGFEAQLGLGGWASDPAQLTEFALLQTEFREHSLSIFSSN